MTAIYIDAGPELVALYERLGRAILPDLHIHRGDPEPQALPALLRGYRGVLNGHTRLPGEVLTQCPGLEHVVFLGTGVSTYVDMDLAAAHGIGVHGIAGYGSRTIAEHAVGLMFAAVRDIARQDRAMRAGQWQTRGGFELRGRTLGVIGVGNVGREMVGLGNALGMRVLVWARRPVDPALSCEQVTLDTLLQQSDVVSLHVAHTPQTEGMLDATRLARMKPGAILVNTARAALVDEQALAACLRSGPLGHAAVDVYGSEPPAADHPLLTLENCTLTAHSAWNSPQAAERLLVLALEKLRDLLEV
ncbi:MAG: 3-phosphoglycerate dehydrogenase [Gammaproteobacteria bacterium]|nr:3-phosphoglycerate dehydrogenase [Gammaproteobacteria bacterium]